MEHKIAPRSAKWRHRHLGFKRYRIGTPPGSLEAPLATPGAAEPAAAPARVSTLHYLQSGLTAAADNVDPHSLVAPSGGAPGVLWVQLQGEPTAAQLQALGAAFGLHPLALEDVYKQETRAKVDNYGAQRFIVLKHVRRDASDTYCIDQLSFFVGKNWLIEFNSGPDDLFAPVRQRIHDATPICGYGVDYLLYSLLDQVIDSGFPLLEELGDRLETLEDEILDEPTRQARNRIHYAKRELVLMRRAWWPQREVIATLMRDEGNFFSSTTRLYLHDCYDHCVIAIDFVEAYREMASSLLDTYLSAVSQRMNDIMKTLTIIATVFLPLMFITGLYGMNFDTASPYNLPELHWRFGYFYALGLMASVAACLLLYFRRKRWI